MHLFIAREKILCALEQDTNKFGETDYYYKHDSTDRDHS